MQLITDTLHTNWSFELTTHGILMDVILATRSILGIMPVCHTVVTEVCTISTHNDKNIRNKKVYVFTGAAMVLSYGTMQLSMSFNSAKIICSIPTKGIDSTIAQEWTIQLPQKG